MFSLNANYLLESIYARLQRTAENASVYEELRKVLWKTPQLQRKPCAKFYVQQLYSGFAARVADAPVIVCYKPTPRIRTEPHAAQRSFCAA